MAVARITVEGRTYVFDEDTADNTELMAIEDVTGLASIDLEDALNRGSMRAITALVWVLRRREEPALLFADVKFRVSSLRFDQGPDDEPGKDEEPSPTNSTDTSSTSPNGTASVPGN